MDEWVEGTCSSKLTLCDETGGIEILKSEKEAKTGKWKRENYALLREGRGGDLALGKRGTPPPGKKGAGANCGLL
jgi:hypothetical protein